MPPLPHVSKVIKVEHLFGLSENVDALSRQFWHYTGTTPSNTDILTFADNAVSGFTANCLEDLHEDFSYFGVLATDLSSDTGAEATSSVVANGTLTGAAMPQDTALVIAYEIARRYRGGHPRGYWPFGDATFLSDPATWNPTELNQMVNDLVSLQTATALGGWSGSGTLTQVNVSYYHGFTVITNPSTGRARNVPTPRPTPLVDNVTTYIGRPRVGSQRRRLGR
jgi:hypothetical protein